VLDIDRELLDRTLYLDAQFQKAIAKLANSSDSADLRIFFTMAHGYITGKIGKHIDLFANPNALMRLNDSFATTYLNALDGKPHDGWQKAFRICKAEGDAVASGPVGRIFVGPVALEGCASCMASVHIRRDLRDALLKVTDVDAQDFGNILIFINEGNLYAEVQARGRAAGAAATIFGHLVGGIKGLNLDVKKWRNEVFLACYKKEVPEPSDTFVAAYHKASGR
jgi:hypothetical protein